MASPSFTNVRQLFYNQEEVPGQYLPGSDLDEFGTSLGTRLGRSEVPNACWNCSEGAADDGRCVVVDSIWVSSRVEFSDASSDVQAESKTATNRNP